MVLYVMIYTKIFVLFIYATLFKQHIYIYILPRATQGWISGESQLEDLSTSLSVEHDKGKTNQQTNKLRNILLL